MIALRNAFIDTTLAFGNFGASHGTLQATGADSGKFGGRSSSLCTQTTLGFCFKASRCSIDYGEIMGNNERCKQDQIKLNAT